MLESFESVWNFSALRCRVFLHNNLFLYSQDTRKSACHVTDVSTSSPDLQEQIINKLLESSEVIISLVFESGATQLRDSVFSQEPKVKFSNPKNSDT